MTHLYLVRHAESMANKNKVFAGHFDVNLSPKGEKQAQALGDYIAENFRIDKIYSSDLSRTVSTARPAAEKLGLEINTDTELREIFAGEWEGKEVDRIISEHAADFRTWMTDFPNARCPGGESVAELYARMSATVDRILAANEGKNIMIVSHAAAIRVFTSYAMCFAANRVNRVKFCANSSLSVFTYDENRYAPEKLGAVPHLAKYPELQPIMRNDIY